MAFKDEYNAILKSITNLGMYNNLDWMIWNGRYRTIINTKETFRNLSCLTHLVSKIILVTSAWAQVKNITFQRYVWSNAIFIFFNIFQGNAMEGWFFSYLLEIVRMDCPIRFKQIILYKSFHKACYKLVLYFEQKICTIIT